MVGGLQAEAIVIKVTAPVKRRSLARVGLDPGRVVAALLIAATVAAGESLGRLLPSIGAPACALVVGMLLRLRWTPAKTARPLLAFASSTVLKTAIVALGATFGLGEVLRVGGTALPLMLGTLAVALIAMYPVGRALGVGWSLNTLVGVGTAICGASAIGAVSGVIEASEVEVAYAISTIFVFNVVAVLLFPALGHLFSLGQRSFGMWAGTAVNDTSSVVAAASTYGQTAAQVAVVTKLARTTMIIPIVVALALRQASRTGAAAGRSWLRLLPRFLVLFLAAAAVHTAGLVRPHAAHDLSRLAGLGITVALAAIGLSTAIAALRIAGYRPLVLGAVLWAVVGVSGLALQTL